MNLTKVTAQFPPIMTKIIHVDTAGNLTKTPAAQLSRGTYETKDIQSPEKLKILIESLNSNEVLLFGIPLNQQPRGTIASRKEAVNGDITRTREAFAFSNGLAWMMLDIDVSTGPGGPDTTWAGVYGMLNQCIPDFESKITHLRGHSAGSFIYCQSTGEELIGERGKRIYIPVKSGSDIPRAGRALAGRLKAKGCLHYQISKAGTLLERGLIDEQMFQPERIDFCSGAKCTGNCYQDRPPLEVVNPDGCALDTETAIVDVTKIEDIELKEHRGKQAMLVADAKAVAREKWIAERLQHKPSGVSIDEYKELLNTAAETQILNAAFPIILAGENDAQGGMVLIGEMLADPRRYNGALCLDPLEPEYNNHSVVGKVYLTGARPLIYSLAHGGQKFYLNRRRHQVPIADGVTEEAANTCLRLLAGNHTIYRRGKYLAEASEGEINALVEPAQVESHLDRQIQFIKRTQRGTHPTDCPPKLAKRIMIKHNDWAFHELRGVVSLPVMRLDGSILDVPGYDPATQLLYSTEPGNEGANVIMHPTRTDISDALFRLWRPFNEFPFASDESRGSVLAAILTTAVRAVLPVAPGYIVNAPAYGTGKTLLARAISLMTGREPVVTGWPKGNEEQGKKLASVLRSGCEALILDNLEGNLEGADLSAIVTSPSWSARILGKSETMEVSTNTMLFATGNNVYAVQDTARRFCVIRINAVSEHPELREFDFSPVELIRSNPKQYRNDCLTVLRGFVAAKSPKIAKTATGSFDDWDRMIRNCICWLIQEKMAPVAMADPITSQAENTNTDPDKQKLRMFIDGVFAVFGCQDFCAAELKRFYNDEGVADDLLSVQSELWAPQDSWSEERRKEYFNGCTELKEALGEIADDRRARGGINTRILGWFMDKHKDAVIGDLAFEKSRKRTNNRTYYHLRKTT